MLSSFQLFSYSKVYNLIYQILITTNMQKQASKKDQSKFYCNITHIQTDTNTDSSTKKLQTTIKDLQDLKHTILQFYQNNQKIKQSYSHTSFTYVYNNFFQNQLLSIQQYIQAQQSFNFILSQVYKLQQNPKSETANDQPHIQSLIQQMQNCQQFIQASETKITNKKSINDTDTKSKNNSIDHLEIIKAALDDCIGNLKQVELTYTQQYNYKKESHKVQQQVKEQLGIKTKSQKHINQTKQIAVIKMQKILQSIIKLMENKNNPQKYSSSTYSSKSSSGNYQLKNLQLYKDLKQIIENISKQLGIMLKPNFFVEEFMKNHTWMQLQIKDSFKKCDDLLAYKNLCTISQKQFINHLDEIKKSMIEIRQKQNQLMTLVFKNQEPVKILESIFGIKKISEKNIGKSQNTKGYENMSISVSLKQLFELKQKSELIQQQTIKLIKMSETYHRKPSSQEDFQRLEGNNQKSYCSELNDETTKTQVLFTKDQFEKQLNERMESYKKTLQLGKQDDLLKLTNQCGLKIKELKEKVGDRQTEIESLKREIDNKSQLENQKNEELNKLNKLIDSLKTKDSCLQSQVQQLQSQITQQEQRYQISLQSQKQNSVKKIKQVLMTVSKIIEQLLTQNQEAKSQTKKISLEEQFKQSEQFKIIQSSLVNIKSKLKQKMKIDTSTNQQQTSTKEQSSQLNKKLDQKNQFIEKHQQINRIQSEWVYDTFKLIELKEVQELVNVLKHTNQNIEIRESQLQQTAYQKIKNSITHIINSQQQQQTQIFNTKQQLTFITQNYCRFFQSIFDTASVKLKQQEKIINQLKQTRLKMQKQIEQVNNSLESKQQNQNQQKEILSEKQTQLNKKTSQIQTLNGQLTQTKQQLNKTYQFINGLLEKFFTQIQQSYQSSDQYSRESQSIDKSLEDIKKQEETQMIHLNQAIKQFKLKLKENHQTHQCQQIQIDQFTITSELLSSFKNLFIQLNQSYNLKSKSIDILQKQISNNQQKLQKSNRSIKQQQDNQRDFSSRIAQIQNSYKLKLAEIKRLEETQKLIQSQIADFIKNNIQETCNSVQMKEKVSALQNQLKIQKQLLNTASKKNQSLEQQVIRLKGSQDKLKALQKENGKLQQDKYKLQVQNKSQIVQITELKTNLQNEKTKYETASSSIQSLNETVNKLKEEKEQLTSAIQKQILQSQEFKDKIRSLENQIQVLNIDFEEKIQTEKQQNKISQQQIKTLSQQITKHKHEIQLINQQNEHLKKQNKRLDEYVDCLKKVEQEKINLQKKVISLQDEIKRLKDELVSHQTKLNESSLSMDEGRKKMRQEIQQLTYKQKEIQSYYECLIVELNNKYEKQKESFQKNAIKSIQGLTVKFNETYQSLNGERISCQRESMKLSSFLVAIYQAMDKMNEFYKTNLSNPYLRTEDHKLILDSVSNGSILNQKQCKKVLMYSVKTIKTLQTLIRLSQRKTKDQLQLYQTQINNILTAINSLGNEKNLKQTLKSYLETLHVNKQQQQVNLAGKLKFQFDQFVRKIADLIIKLEVQSIQIINKVKKDYEQQKAKDKTQIQIKFQKINNEHEKQFKAKDNQITNLKKQNQLIRSEINTKTDEINKYKADITKKNKDISDLKDLMQEKSMSMNKKMKEESEKFELQISKQKEEIQKLEQNYAFSESKKEESQRKLKELQNTLGGNQSSLSQAKREIQNLTKKVSDRENELRETKDELQRKKNKIQQMQKSITRTNSSKSSQQLELRNKEGIINQKQIEIQQLKEQVRKLKHQIDQQQTQTKNQISQINKSLTKKQSQLEQIQKQLSKYETLVSIVLNTFSSKIHKQISVDQLISQINNFNPSIGMKLIYSSILHGHDLARTQINQQTQLFTGKIIKKTDLLARYPDTKSMIHQLPKEANNFPFIVMYKTAKGTVFGSFSEGIKKRTFIFSFVPLYQETKDVRFFFANNPAPQSSSVQIFQAKNLQYGSGELRINCIDMSSISANSDAVGAIHYGLDWRVVMNEQNEAKVALCQVELHRVEFQ